MYLYKPRQPLRCEFLLSLLLALAIPAASTPGHSVSNGLYGNMIVRHAREVAPEGFAYVNNLSDDAIIDLKLSLRGRDADGLVKQLYAVSTPGSPSYGKHLSKEEAESYIRPTDEAVRKVNAWLTYYGVQSKIIGPSDSRLQVTLPVSKANKMLQANFSTFRQMGTGTESFQTLSYSLPSQLSNIIDSVEPTTSFPGPGAPSLILQTFTQRPDLAAVPCNKVITPNCLVQLYGIPTAKATQPGNILSVAGFLNSYANRKDLALFLSSFRPDLNGSTFTEQYIDGGQNPQGPGTAGDEANLDIQYTVGLVNFDPVTFVSSGLGDINGFIDLAYYWVHQTNPPTVVSISYGINEDLVSADSAKSLCALFVLLGARGTSILVASGDGGVSGSQYNKSCTGAFVPALIGSCPYVTAVGATGGFPAESGASLSSGGFSHYFGQVNQTAAVDGYLKQIGLLYNGRFNRSGRGYPDISAQGENIRIVINQTEFLVNGTSAATPIVASIITLLNDRLLKRGRKALGFLNPWLYANPGILNDITTGSNPGCGTSGFPAKGGWDPVTGLGTPNFSKMAANLGV